MLGCPRFYYRKTTAVLCGLCFLALLLFGPGTPSRNSLARKAIHASRISKLHSGCQKIHGSQEGQKKANADSLRISDIVDNVFINRQHGLLYCSIAKVGCSFWKRVLKVLDGAYSGKLHLFDIKGIEVHFNIPDSMTLKNTTPEAFKSMLETYMQFIFVRDPFERLFSAYVDKILIPTVLQTRVVKFFLDQNLVAKESLPCNRKISFGDFSSLLADAIMQKNYFEYHFSTMTSQCHPCQFNFTMVGKMETFMADVREVFRRAHIDMSEVVGDVEDIDSTNDLASIKDVIERVWRFYTSSPNDCLSHTETAERLWRNLQIRGFISKTISLPPNQSNSGVFSLENFTSAATRAYEQSEPRHVRMRQREEAMMEAYSLVPRVTLEKLSRLYAEDCLLFSYSCDIDRFLNHKVEPFYFKSF